MKNRQLISLLETAGLDSDKASELSAIITEALQGKNQYEQDVRALTEAALVETRSLVKASIAEGLAIIPKTVVEGLSGQLLTEAKEAIQSQAKDSFKIQADMVHAANKQLLEAGRLIKEMEDEADDMEDELEESKNKLKEKDEECEDLKESVKAASDFIDAILSCDSVSKLDKIAELRESQSFSFSKGYAILESNVVAQRSDNSTVPFATNGVKQTSAHNTPHSDVAKYMNI